MLSSDLLPHAGSREYCSLDSFVDLGAILVYIVCLFTSYASSLILFLHFFPYLSFSLRTDSLHFQAGGGKGQPNQGFFVVMATLCNRAGHYIFALWFLSIYLLSSFFHCLISAVAEWMSTILWRTMWS